jgi:2-polyprenyl-6-methoxyphenol hydroxylase-like FAD-dependent oxidoreductase
MQSVAAELLAGPSVVKGIPHVTGVRTVDGEEFSADLVVDATGRGSKLPSWLEALGARRPIEEAETSGFIYYTQYFRCKTGALPLCRAALMTYFHCMEHRRLRAGKALHSMIDV